MSFLRVKLRSECEVYSLRVVATSVSCVQCSKWLMCRSEKGDSKVYMQEMWREYWRGSGAGVEGIC